MSDDRKISPEFMKRLSALPPAASIRAIVFLEIPNDISKKSSISRSEKADLVKAALAGTMTGIDDILGKYGGSRLDREVSALGSVVVQTSARGVMALARKKRVKSIIEDQPVNGHL